MSEFDLDDVKLKTPDEMSDEEKDFLKENEDKLTDADKKDYEEILKGKKENEDETEEEDETEKKDKKKEKKEEPKHTFKTDEDLEVYLKDRKEKEKAEKVKLKADAKVKKGQFFPKGYKPSDWNEYTKDVLKIVRDDRQRFSEDQRKTMARINDKLDSETEELRALIPDIPKQGTKARRTFDRNIAEVMIKNKSVTTVASAYKQLRGESKAKKVAKEKKTNLAKKIGKGTGTADAPKEAKYEKFAKRDLDDAAEAALDKFEKLS